MTRYLVALAFLASPALAQTPECVSRADMAATLAKAPWHEEVRHGAISGASLVEVYISVDGPSFTVTATGSDNCARMVFSGTDWTDMDLARTLNPTRYHPIPGARLTSD